jgi:hypothetical protein
MSAYRLASDLRPRPPRRLIPSISAKARQGPAGKAALRRRDEGPHVLRTWGESVNFTQGTLLPVNTAWAWPTAGGFADNTSILCLIGGAASAQDADPPKSSSLWTGPSQPFSRGAMVHHAEIARREGAAAVRSGEPATGPNNRPAVKHQERDRGASLRVSPHGRFVRSGWSRY